MVEDCITPTLSAGFAFHAVGEEKENGVPRSSQSDLSLYTLLLLVDPWPQLVTWPHQIMKEAGNVPFQGAKCLADTQRCSF